MRNVGFHEFPSAARNDAGPVRDEASSHMKSCEPSKNFFASDDHFPNLSHLSFCARSIFCNHA